MAVLKHIQRRRGTPSPKPVKYTPLTLWFSYGQTHLLLRSSPVFVRPELHQHPLNLIHVVYKCSYTLLKSAYENLCFFCGTSVSQNKDIIFYQSDLLPVHYQPCYHNCKATSNITVCCSSEYSRNIVGSLANILIIFGSLVCR